MLLKIGYFLRGVSKKIGEVIEATMILFADNSNYTADTTVISADNDSSLT